MTEQEFNSFIEEQKKSGKSEEDIVKIFCVMFKEGQLPRDQLEAVIEALGYEMSDELKALGDEELKEKIVTKSEDEGEVTKEDKIDPDGDVPPPANKENEPKAEETEETEKKEAKETKEDGEEEESEEDERKRAMRLFGLEK